MAAREGAKRLGAAVAAGRRPVHDPEMMTSGRRTVSYSKIKVPAGLKTAWMGSMTSGLQSDNPTEREVVLPPNTRLYIHKVELDADSGGYGKRTIVTAEVVPEDWEPPASSKDYAGVTSGPIG